MHDVAAMAVKVDALLAHLRADEHFWQERRVEPAEDAVPRVELGVPRHEVHATLPACPGCIEQRAPRIRWVSDVSAGAGQIFEEHAEPAQQALATGIQRLTDALHQERGPSFVFELGC